MGDVLFHSERSVAKHGGVPADYFRLHEFLDCSKLFLGDWRHRALLHSTFGVMMAEKHVFGTTYTRESDQVACCTRTLVTDHILDDLGWIPTPQDFLVEMPLRVWMGSVDPGGRNKRADNLTRSEVLWHRFPQQKPMVEGEYLVGHADAFDDVFHYATAQWTSGRWACPMLGGLLDSVVSWAKPPAIPNFKAT